MKSLILEALKPSYFNGPVPPARIFGFELFDRHFQAVVSFLGQGRDWEKVPVEVAISGNYVTEGRRA